MILISKLFVMTLSKQERHIIQKIH
jgi:hypothetical protein